MRYEFCRNCKYVCKCCKHRGDYLGCSGCENKYDEFVPAENIKYCPLTGKDISETNNKENNNFYKYFKSHM